MAVFFAYNVVDLRVYGETLRLLKTSKGGDLAARAELLRRVRPAVSACAAHIWNRDTPSIQGYANAVEAYASEPAQPNFDRFARIAVRVLPLPLFQFWPRAGQEQSPNYAYLADSDGGLYEVLCRERGVEDVVASDGPLQPYPMGEATVLLPQRACASSGTVLPRCGSPRWRMRYGRRRGESYLKS